jgi:hypothetical protein
MPLLGFRHIGPQQREVPSAVFFDLLFARCEGVCALRLALHDGGRLRRLPWVGFLPEIPTV